MCSRLGANVAVTQLKSNNHIEGQLVFFFFFSPSSAALYRRLGTVSKPTLFSLWLSRKKKVSFSYIHARNLSFWCLSVDYEQEAIVSSSVCCTYLHITVTVGHTCSVQVHMRTLTLSDAYYVSSPGEPVFAHGTQSTCLSRHVLFLKYSPCNLCIHTFFFLSTWSWF